MSIDSSDMCLAFTVKGTTPNMHQPLRYSSRFAPSRLSASLRSAVYARLRRGQGGEEVLILITVLGDGLRDEWMDLCESLPGK